jgi:hypothetical protein
VELVVAVEAAVVEMVLAFDFKLVGTRKSGRR